MRPDFEFEVHPEIGGHADLPPGAAIIDLGTDRGLPDGYARPDRRTVPAWFAPVMVACLVLLSTAASASPPPSPLAQVLSLRVAPDDSYALTDDGMLLVHSPGMGTLTGYELSDGTQRWQAEATVPAYRMRSGDGLVLLRARGVAAGDPGTVALSTRTGEARWRVPGSILTIPGSPTVLAVDEVRSVSGEGRRIEGPITGLDPITGRTRWTVPIPSTAVMLGVPGNAAVPPNGGTAASEPQPRMLLVHDSGLAELHDLDTGRRLASVRLPAADYEPANPGMTGGMLLIRHPGRAGPEVTEYDPATLQQKWNSSAGYAYEIRACGDLACLIGRGGVRALDPADGTPRWSRPGWRSIEQRGRVMLAYGSLTGDADLVGVVDAATGRVEETLRHWRPVPGPGGGDHVLVTRTAEAGASTMVAVADTGSDRPRPLGELPAGTGDCRAVPDRLVCRSTSGDLIVWSYTWR